MKSSMSWSKKEVLNNAVETFFPQLVIVIWNRFKILTELL